MKCFYLVWRDGTPLTTVRHSTLSEAEREAVRLAKKHPDQSFYILEAVTVVQAVSQIHAVNLTKLGAYPFFKTNPLITCSESGLYLDRD